MKSWGRFLFIFFAYGIALLHTAVPHQHGQSRIGESVILHAGCIFSESNGGLLQKVLSTDLGSGHLENFKKGGADINFSAAFAFVVATTMLYPALITPDHVDANEAFLGYIEKLKRKRLLFSVSHLRAPPVC